jgi:hypothetical protein
VPPAAGDGLTTATAYRITELGNLLWLQEQTDAGLTSGTYYALANDIDARVTATWNDDGTTSTTSDTCVGFRPIGYMGKSFKGIFDGEGHAIVGLTVNRPNRNSVGLFADIERATIRNLALRGGTVSGGASAGALAGVSGGSTVTGCSASTTVTAQFYFWPPWYGYTQAGGLIGFSSNDAIAGSSATGAVVGDYAGGLVGESYASAITNCYALGRARGSWDVGGLQGECDLGSIRNCYAAGQVVDGFSIRTGGLVARATSATVSCSYWDVEATSQTASAGGTGKTTAEMKEQATFLEWDFAAVWAIAPDTNQGYPYLRPPVAHQPNKPVGPSPANGATDRPLDTTLAWQNGGGATSYDVYFDTANPPVTRVAASQTETSYTPPSSLGYATTYFWRIDATNAAGTAPGDVWSFTTVPTPIVPGHFLSSSVRSSHSEKWDAKDARVVGKDAYSFSGKMLLPLGSLASLSNATTLTLVLGDAVTSGAACEVFERPLSAATKSTLAGHPTAKKPKDPARGGSVTFVELQPGSAKKARVVSIKWTKTGLLTATVLGTPSPASWDPANPPDPAEHRKVENIADLCDGTAWPAGAATGVAVPALVEITGVVADADTVTCAGKKGVKSSDGGDLVGWSISGK